MATKLEKARSKGPMTQQLFVLEDPSVLAGPAGMARVLISLLLLLLHRCQSPTAANPQPQKLTAGHTSPAQVGSVWMGGLTKKKKTQQ
jgi:hypothetical protein